VAPGKTRGYVARTAKRTGAGRRRDAPGAGKRTKESKEYDEAANPVHSRHVLSQGGRRFKSSERKAPAGVEPACAALQAAA
jgi:hypothetical protein